MANKLIFKCVGCGKVCRAAYMGGCAKCSGRLFQSFFLEDMREKALAIIGAG